MIGLEQALTEVLSGAGCLGVERIATAEAAGRVLAEAVTTARPMPAFTYSAVDGYALATSELAVDASPVRFAVRGESRAGGALPEREPGTASRIFTGAELPAGCDAVIMQEDVTREGDAITFTKRPLVGANVRYAGADLPAGARALEPGARLHPGAVGLCVALDRAHVLVGRRPVVAILPTGNELRAPGEPGDARSIPDSNTFVLAAIARAAGAVVRTLPPLRDEQQATEEALATAMIATDLLVTIGGVSVGDHDRVRPALAACGVELAFWGVAVKPGKPTAFGRTKTGRVLCVPGNPAAALVIFTLFGVPLLRAWQGDPTPVPRAVRLPVRGSLRRRPGRAELLRARLERDEDGGERASIERNQASGAVVSSAWADALVHVPSETTDVRDGDRLDVLRLSDYWC